MPQPFTATDTICHNCGAADPWVFHTVRNVPVHSCLLLDSAEEARDYPRGDINLAFCRHCGFVQNSTFDEGVHDYSPRYEESQAYSPRFNSFARELAEDYNQRYDLAGKTVLEIGCGKGDFLVGLCEFADCSGIGIDPSYRADRRNAESLQRTEFIADFYSEAYGDLHADLVLCRHTLEHIPRTRAFLETIRKAIGDRVDTAVSFELPALERIIEERAFWDIYYEHCSYFTADSLRHLFESTGFEVTEQRSVYDDQYLVIDAKVAEPAPSAEPIRVKAWEAAITSFAEDVERKIAEWRAYLASARSRNERIALWGSGSKAVAFMTTLEIEPDEVDHVVDVNPHRHGKFMPGTGHRIAPPTELMASRPDIVIAMNPIYLTEIEADLRAMGLHPELTAV